jgi:hypothetical protein
MSEDLSNCPKIHPAMTSLLAVVCLRQCHVKSSIPAASTAVDEQIFEGGVQRAAQRDPNAGRQQLQPVPARARTHEGYFSIGGCNAYRHGSDVRLLEAGLAHSV